MKDGDALVVCACCHRHVRSSERACPFCVRGREGARRPPIVGATVVFAASAGLALSGCSKAPNGEADARAETVAPAPELTAAVGPTDGGPGPAATPGTPGPDAHASRGNVAVGYGPSPGIYGVVGGGTVANAASIVAGMKPGFQRCYNQGLQEDPSMKGSVRITAKIGSNGEVLSASPGGGGSLSGTVIACVTARVASAQFAPPDGGSATIVIPVTFVSQ